MKAITLQQLALALAISDTTVRRRMHAWGIYPHRVRSIKRPLTFRLNRVSDTLKRRQIIIEPLPGATPWTRKAGAREGMSK